MKPQTISSGDLGFRISIILAPSITRSADSNEVIKTPGATVTVWAMRESDIKSNVQEGEIGLTLAQKKYVYYVIRYRPNIGANCTVTDAYGTYNVEAVDTIGRKNLLKLKCELITQDNV